MWNCKKEPGMFTPLMNVIGLGSPVLRSLIQANLYPAARSCGRCGGERHT
jgi:hypothetical protein